MQAAHEKLATEIAKYGANSQQATDAENKLQAAQDALTVAHERANEAQRNVSNSMMMFGVSVVPTVISAITMLNALTEAGTLAKVASSAASAADAVAESAQAAATGLASGAMAVLDAVMDANPILLVVAAIAAITAAFIWAYNACPPFRDAINEIGKVLGGAFSAAINDVKAGLEWLWNNVLVPIGNFLGTVFNAYLQSAILMWHGLGEAVSLVYDGLKWLWDNVLTPLAKFLSLFCLLNGMRWHLGLVGRIII